MALEVTNRKQTSVATSQLPLFSRDLQTAGLYDIQTSAIENRMKTSSYICCDYLLPLKDEKKMLFMIETIRVFIHYHYFWLFVKDRT